MTISVLFVKFHELLHFLKTYLTNTSAQYITVMIPIHLKIISSVSITTLIHDTIHIQAANSATVIATPIGPNNLFATLFREIKEKALELRNRYSGDPM